MWLPKLSLIRCRKSNMILLRDGKLLDFAILEIFEGEEEAMILTVIPLMKF